MDSSPGSPGAGTDYDNRSAFMFRQPASALEFDGERYVSGLLGDIQAEHYHRYLFALRLCSNRAVLDIASGEGYGSALLGQAAHSVVGVDVSQNAVNFANRAYLSANVSYRVGDASSLPIEDASIDVVVSFETLEHLSDHDGFFREIRRVLRPNGLLVMSSPNRPVFHAQYGDDNHFHVRELDRREFVEALNAHFKHHRLLEQRSISGSVILGTAGDVGQNTRVEGFDSPDGLLFERHRGVPNPPYFIAIASDSELPPVSHSVMHSPLYRAHMDKLREGLEAALAAERTSKEELRLGLEGALEAERTSKEELRLGLEGTLAAERTSKEELRLGLESALEAERTSKEELRLGLESALEAERTSKEELRLGLESALEAERTSKEDLRLGLESALEAERTSKEELRLGLEGTLAAERTSQDQLRLGLESALATERASREQLQLAIESERAKALADLDAARGDHDSLERRLAQAAEALSTALGSVSVSDDSLRELSALHETLLQERNSLISQVDMLAQQRISAQLSIAQFEWECTDLNARLAETQGRLCAIETSTSWKITYFPRRLLFRHPGLARLLGRTVKLLWWSVTGRIFRKVAEYRSASRAIHPLPIEPKQDLVEAGKIDTAVVTVKAEMAFTVAGPGYEDVDPTLFDPANRKAKVVALYLPQFHPIPENDAWWGKGFTEWRNVTLAQPWFQGHYQPRLPRDLGYYDLRLPEAIRAQADLARSMGVFGFCYYYYYFNGKRILEKPIELFLADRSIDFPFCIMWANENWTRRWDGHDSQVLLHQDYRPENDAELVDDLARHFADPRYIRLQGRPLFTIYRVNLIPNAAKTIEHWRVLFRSRHGVNPLIYMVQGFGINDPAEFGLDGAIEFPPHKLAEYLPSINDDIGGIREGFEGRVIDYSAVVDRSLAVEKPPFDLIRAVMQAWDNVPRRGAHGHIYHGSSPAKFGAWLTSMIDFASNNPVSNESFVFVNAWNEWAEGTTLEPDIYWGGAYLNAVARAVSGPPAVSVAQPFTSVETVPVAIDSKDGKRKLLIIGHDAYRHGAQLNCLALVRHMREVFGLDVAVILLGAGPLEDSYSAVAPTHIVDGDATKLRSLIRSLAEDGYRWAICNTVVTGECVPILKQSGFDVISLVHEMPALIRERKLENAAHALALYSDTIVFATEHVRDSFATVTAVETAKTLISPQGLYQELPIIDGAPLSLRRRLDLPDDAIVVLNAGYGDLRKGIDLFIDLARRVTATDSRFYFVWLGDLEEQFDRWIDRLDIAAETIGHIRQIAFDPDIAEYFQAADIFALTSREDPFPSVVLEALAYGTPVVAFDGGGGYAELVVQDSNGVLVPYLDVEAMALALHDVASAVEFRSTESRALRMEQSRRRFDFRRFAFGLLRSFEPDLNAVSVVVPNYNYARHIERRLDSIFAQTYPIFEILVLDDASTDNSIEMIKAFSGERRRDVGLRINARNSGSVFKQWSRGAGEAQGALLWIAEADDLSSASFIETMVREFADADVNMAFCDSSQIDENDALLADSYSGYYLRHVPALKNSLKLPGKEFLRRVLSVRNVVFNVSSVIFRKDALAAALLASTQEFELLRVAGDWNVYVELCCQPGSIAYVAEALNSHRRHANSVTLSLDHWRHLAEIFAIHRKVGSILGTDGFTDAQATYMTELINQFDLVPPEGRSVELMAAAKWLDDLAGDERILFAALRTFPIDLVGELLLDVPAECPAARAALPMMPAAEVQISWTGSHGMTLLRQSCSFVRAVGEGFIKHAGRPLDDAKILDYGCGWGRLIRLMYKFTLPENLYACDPWDRSIELCEESNIRAHLVQSEYLPTASPFPKVKFDLIYAFSVFTHLSERSATAVMAVFRQAIADDGICVVTIRPISYWDAHDQAQNIVDRDEMKRAHETRGFAFTPHQRDAVDGDITYGDTSISLNYIRDNWIDWDLVGHYLFEHDPFQTLIFLKPRILPHV